VGVVKVGGEVARALEGVPEDVAANAALDALARRGRVDEAVELLERLVRGQEAATAKFSLSEPVLAVMVDAVASVDGGREMARLLAAASGTEAVQLFGLEWRVVEGDGDGGTHRQKPTALPDNDRVSEITAGLVFLGVAATGFSLEVIDSVIHQSTILPTTMLMMAGGLVVGDRYFGSGGIYRSVAGGLTRLLSFDPARECRVDAAAFLVAYLLGIPFVCFRPDVGEILKNHSTTMTYMKPHLGHPKVFRLYLTWILGGVAAEASIDGRLIESGSERALQLCTEARKQQLLSWSDQEVQDKIMASYGQAQDLLQRYREMHIKLTQRMLEGATAGECVAFLESLTAN